MIGTSSSTLARRLCDRKDRRGETAVKRFATHDRYRQHVNMGSRLPASIASPLPPRRITDRETIERAAAMSLRLAFERKDAKLYSFWIE
jgi:hypothetical protein